MAIQIKGLERIAKQFETKDHIFKDLHLDFSKTSLFDTIALQRREGNDIQVDYDLSAIRNSLKNLFNTRPGQRFLFPLYGLDLYQYLFEAITDSNARLIGESIVRAIETYEPRVKVVSCNITPKPDDNTYLIDIIVEMPTLRTKTTLNTILNTKQQTFIFLETSRNH